MSHAGKGSGCSFYANLILRPSWEHIAQPGPQKNHFPQNQAPEPRLGSTAVTLSILPGPSTSSQQPCQEQGPKDGLDLWAPVPEGGLCKWVPGPCPVSEHKPSRPIQPESWCPCHVTLVPSSSSSLMHLFSRQLPHAPEHPVATLSTTERRAINLTWAKPFDGNSPLIRYVLEMSENSKVPGSLGLEAGLGSPSPTAISRF